MTPPRPGRWWRRAAAVAGGVLGLVATTLAGTATGADTTPSTVAERSRGAPATALAADALADTLPPVAVPSPIALEPLPGGGLLVATQPGLLRLIGPDGTLAPTPVLDLRARTCTNGERGLLGVALDPTATVAADRIDGSVYVMWTVHGSAGCPTGVTTGAPTQRLSRFTVRASVADPASEVVLLGGISSFNGNHNGGDVEVAPDGTLLVSTGDAGCDPYRNSGCAGANDASRDRHSLLGKVVRITRDGQVPAGNPWTGAGTASCRTGPVAAGLRCQEAYAWGLRNPFRIAVTGTASAWTLLANDVGQDVAEEVDAIVPGADYGWNVREGPCLNRSTTNCPPPVGMVDPIHTYLHTTRCHAITGGVFAPAGWWPGLDGSYLFTDLTCGHLTRLVPGALGWLPVPAGEAGTSPIDLAAATVAGRHVLAVATYEGGGTVRFLDGLGRPTASWDPVDPVTLVDTSTGTGAPTGPVTAGTTLSLDVAAATGRPASSLAAASLTVTAVDPATAGFLAPAACDVRPSTSALNVTAGRSTTTQVLVPVDGDGRACLVVAATTGLRVSVTAVAVQDGAAPPGAGLGLDDTAPTRLADSRARRSGERVSLDRPLRLPFTMLGGEGAVALNVTVTGASEAGTAVVARCRAGMAGARPVVSYAAGTTIASTATFPVTTGDVCVWATAPAHVIVDRLAHLGAASASRLVTVPPMRVLDSRRTGAPASAAPVVVDLLAQGGLPATPGPVVVTLTAVSPAAAAYLQVGPCDALRPAVSHLNLAPGEGARANTVTVAGGADGRLCVWASAPTHVIVDAVAAWR